MESFVNKLSEYNIANNLLIGVIGYFFSQFYYAFEIDNIFLLIFIIYFIGMTINRIGSCLIEPLLVKIKVINKSNYDDYYFASNKDKKIDILNQERNVYRSLCSLIIIVIIVDLLKYVVDITEVPIIIYLIILLIIYGISFIKQNKYVYKRVAFNIKKSEKS